MPSPYELGPAATPAAASGAAYLTIHTGATRKARIWEIGIFVNAATSSSVGLGIPANTPVATTSELVQQLDRNDPAGTVNVDTAWSTAPTVPAHFLRRIVIPATIAAGNIWVFQRPLVLPVSSWLCLWNFGGLAGSALTTYFSIEEE